MIDFIKLDLSYLKPETLLSNDSIEWSQGFDPTTAEISDTTIRGKLHNMKIVITENQIILSGSLHILWNMIKKDDRQNWDDFNYKDLSSIVFWLKTNLGLDPQRSKIQNLEYGINIGILKDPTDLIVENLIVWNGKVHTKNMTFDNKGKYIEWVMSQYSQKMYNKGNQYKRDSHILRWEKKAIKSEYINKKGIYVLSDLLNKDYLEHLLDDLLDSFDKLVLVDTLNPDVTLSEKDQKIWNKGINPKTWENLKRKHRAQRSRLNKNLSQILRANGLDKRHHSIRDNIKTKGIQLIECNVLTDLREPTLKGPETENATFLHLDNRSIRNTSSTGIETAIITLFPIPKNETAKKRYSKRKPEDVPDSDIPEVKKLRNDKSNSSHNIVRAYKKKLDYLDKIGYSHLTKNLRIPNDDKIKLLKLVHLAQWQPILSRLNIK